MDSAGNAYIAGTTPSKDFPLMGAFQQNCIGCNSSLLDSFVAKLNPAGSALLYSTYLGGNGDTEAQGIGINSNGQAYVAGLTTATDFPTVNAIQSVGGGGIFSISSTGAVATSNSGLKSSVINGIVGDSSGIYASTFSPGTDGVNGIFKSTDGGQSWTKVSAAPARIETIALDPSHAGTIYGAAPFAQAVLKSIDGGATWTSSGKGLPSTFFPSVTVDPSNPNNIYLGGSNHVGIYVSTDGGNNWGPSSTGLPSGGYDEIKSIVVDPTNPNTVYVSLFTQFGSSPGIFKSTDGGAHWTASNSGLTNTAVQALTMDPNNHLMLYAGTLGPSGSSGGIFKSINGGTSWSPVLDTSTASEDVTALAADGASNVYAGFSGAPLRGGAWKSTDGGMHWTEVGLDGSTVPAIFPGSTTLAGTSDSLTGTDISGNPDAFITQFSAAGNALGYSTFLGGTNYDQANGIAVMPSGNAFITGYTNSIFPTTQGAYNTSGHRSNMPVSISLPPVRGAKQRRFCREDQCPPATSADD